MSRSVIRLLQSDIAANRRRAKRLQALLKIIEKREKKKKGKKK